jgi:cytochrome c2
LLLASRLGEMWFVGADRNLRPLDLRIPVNVDEFEGDPSNRALDLADQFGVKDLLVQHLPTGVRLFATHNFWYADRDCYVLRVSSLETTGEALRGGAATSSAWRTVFETTPCLPLQVINGVKNPTKDAGGRLVALSESEVLLSVGRFGARGGDDRPPDYTMGPQTRDNSYGKTILIDVTTGDARIYTLGHRNPEGMTLAPDGSVILTEHGPRGGDELNLVVEGRNYGWPIVTYGTYYDSTLWGTTYSKTHHEGFEKPVYVWVPAIGVSQLIAVQGKAFQHWAGDLLVASLAGQTLFRMHLAEGRAVVVEPIPIGHRIRDLVELNDGSIAMKTDDDLLLFLEPAERAHVSGLDAAGRGHIIAARCTGCHSFTAEGPEGLGPALWGVVGRPVASRSNYAYSPALEALGGTWTIDRLRAYISNPEAVAPGTRMERIEFPDSQSIDDLLAFLETLR